MFRDTCPPADRTCRLRTFRPPAVPASGVPSFTVTSAAVARSLIYPIVLTADLGAGITQYANSNLISEPYLIRGIVQVSNHDAVVTTHEWFASVRATGSDQADAAAYDGGQQLLGPWTNQDEWAGGTSVPIVPLWIPVSLGPHRLVGRFRQGSGLTQSCSIIVLITPAASIQPDLPTMEGPINPPSGDGICPPGTHPVYRQQRAPDGSISETFTCEPD